MNHELNLEENEVVDANYQVWNNVYKETPRLRYPDLVFIHYLMKYVPLNSTKKALVLGPGDGTEVFPMARLGISVEGVDISENAAERLNRFAVEEGLSSLVKGTQGDQRDLSRFADNSLDLVVSWSVISYLSKEDGQKAIDEIYRVLRPGGSFIGLLESVDHTGYSQPGAERVRGDACTFKFPENPKQSRAGLVMTFYNQKEAYKALEKFSQTSMSHRVQGLPPDMESKVGQWMFHCLK